MTQAFIETLLLTLLHSVWQLAVLFLGYKFIAVFFLKQQSLARRNLLYVSLGLQFLISIASFIYILLQGSAGFTDFSSASFSWSSLTGHPVLGPLFFYSYLLIVCVKSFRLVLLQRKENILFRRNLSPAPVFLQQQLNRFSTDIKQTVHICCTETKQLLTPFVYGILRPTIVFPIALVNALSTEETEALLLHELAHIRHYDYLLNLFLCVAEIIYFFNPFVHIISGELKLEREKACDAHVVGSGIEEKLYALTLYKIALPVSPQKLALSATGNSKHLLKRIHAITGQENNKNKLSLPRLVLASLAIVLALLPGFINGVNKLEMNMAKAGTELLSKSILLPLANEQTTLEVKPLFINAEAVVDNPLVIVDPSEDMVIEDPLAQTIIIDKQYKSPPADIVNSDGQIYSLANYEADNITETIYIEEENSQGQKTLTAVTVTLMGDSLVTTPLWQIEKGIAPKDSKLRKDSTRVMH